MKSVIFLSIIIALTLSNQIALGQDAVPGVVKIKVANGTLIQQLDAMSISNLASLTLRTKLTNLNCQSITKIFKGSTPSDTLGIDLQGNAVRKSNLSCWLKLVFDPNSNLDQIVDSLLSVPGVLKAQKTFLVSESTLPSELQAIDDQRAQWGLYNPDSRNLDGTGH